MIRPSTPGTSELPLSKSQLHNNTRFAKYVTCDVQLIICYHLNNNFWVVLLTKLFCMQFSLFSSQFLPLKQKSYYHGPIFDRPWPVHFP
jgi:hypothetical protein